LLVLHLSLIEGVGPATIDTIIKSRLVSEVLPEKSWSDIYQYDLSDFVRMGIAPNIAKLVKLGLVKRALLEQELAYIDKYAIEWVTVYDAEYSFLLKHISYPPAIIYTRGAQLAVHKKNVAIVGSRAADAYAKQVVDAFVPELVAAGWSIVSGGALGVDSMAHTAAVAAGGRTVVVLGSGLLRPYPRSNTKLFNQIAESGGTIVSSFGLTVDPMAGNFPARNRIIAGLSSGCVVVQAALKSGASITAQYALDSGRTVFAVPGMVDNPLSAGCHALLKEGACVATSASDILKELGESVSTVGRGLQVIYNKENRESKEDKKGAERKESLVKQVSLVQESQKKKFYANESKVKDFEIIESREQEILASKSSGKEKNISGYAVDSFEHRLFIYCLQQRSLEELAQHINQTPHQTQQILSDMQLDGRMSQNFAGLWMRV